MALIRYIYGPDIREFGDKPVVVEEVEAKVLTAMRRATRVTESDLTELTKPELTQVAEQVDAPVRQRDPKGHFVKAIAEATEQ
jgi:hypothetical protein